MRVKAGLILEGGAERGVFTAGALDYLMERDLWFEYTCGVSAGACNAVDYISRQPGRSRRAMIPYKKSWRMAKFSSVVRQRSLIDMKMLFDSFPNEEIPFDYETYFKSDLKCDLVVTNCRTGRAEYMDERQDRDYLMQILRASSSIPVFSPAVNLKGTEYVDGGVADAIPLVHSMELGYRKNLVISTRPRGYRKKGPGRAAQAFYKTVYRKYPELTEVLLTRHNTYNHVLNLAEKWSEQGKVFLLQPEMQPVGRLEMDPEKLTPFYEHGYELMKAHYDELIAYLESGSAS